MVQFSIENMVLKQLFQILLFLKFRKLHFSGFSIFQANAMFSVVPTVKCICFSTSGNVFL